MENIINQIDELCSKLNEANDAYYNGDREIMSNQEFDDAMRYLANLQEISGYYPENSPVGKVGASIRDSLVEREVFHEIRARSLDKTKNVNDIFAKLGGNVNELAVSMWKLDGCTLILTYKDGNLVLAATRGDGELGQDVTSNAKYIKGIPQHISMPKGKLIVRGECVIRYTDFEEINNNLPDGAQPYANPRNLASASVSMLNPEDMKDRRLNFLAFDLSVVEGQEEFESEFDDIFESPDSLVDQFNYLGSSGFGVVPFRLFRLNEIEDVISDCTKAAPMFDYPVDGLVFALDDRSKTRDLPGTEHHPDPKYGYAFKWADEEVETVLREIEWSPSRTGLLNPVAIFDPVQIAGTTVSRASLHNITQMHRILGPHPFVGETILVMKANMVIPIVTKGFWEGVYSRGT